MVTIRFDRQDELDELIARIYLDTSRKFSKKELLELIFEIGTRDYNLLLKKVQEPKINDDQELRSKFIETLSGVITIPDAGKGSTNPKEIWERDVD